MYTRLYDVYSQSLNEQLKISWNCPLCLRWVLFMSYCSNFVLQCTVTELPQAQFEAIKAKSHSSVPIVKRRHQLAILLQKWLNWQLSPPQSETVKVESHLSVPTVKTFHRFPVLFYNWRNWSLVRHQRANNAIQWNTHIVVSRVHHLTKLSSCYKHNFIK